MKKHLILISLALAATTSFAQSKIDAQSRMALTQLTATAAQNDRNNAPESPTAEQQTVEVMVRMEPGHSPEEISIDGVEVGVTRSEFGVVSLPLSKMEALEALPEVRSISYKQAMIPCLTQANKDTGADRVHQGVGLTQPYTGKGVTVGVLDNWLDPNHVMFRDSKTGENRVQLFITSEGRVLSTPQKIADYEPTADNKSSDHGTHVTGIAAGHFDNGDISLTGAAPESNIVMGYLSEDLASFMKKLEAFVRFAKKHGTRLVINMSYSPIGGSHDGTGALAAYIDTLSKQEDVVFCLASGNDGAYYCNQTYTFSEDLEQVRTFLNGTVGNIDVWSSDSREVGVAFVAYDKSQKRIVSDAVQIELYGSNSVNVAQSGTLGRFFSGTINSTAYIDKNNYHYNAFVNLNLSKNSSDDNIVLGMIIAGQKGLSMRANTTVTPRFVPVDEQYPGWGIGVSRDGSSTDFGTGTEAIVVGSYNTTDRVTFASGKTYSLASYGFSDQAGDVSSFTSYGSYPTGRSYPHILAPGAFIESSMNTYYMENNSIGTHNPYTRSVTVDGRTYYFTSYIGTSLASPFMAGTAALWLEANPSLSHTDIRDIAMKTARRDAQVEAANQVQCGAGKLDVYEGLKEALRRASTDVRKIDSERDFLFNSPARGQYDFFVAGATSMQAVVCNVQGQTVRTVSAAADTLQLNTNGLVPGVYVVKVMSGKKCHSVKIVVD